jgi:hypothetical protein
MLVGPRRLNVIDQTQLLFERQRLALRAPEHGNHRRHLSREPLAAKVIRDRRNVTQQAYRALTQIAGRERPFGLIRRSPLGRAKVCVNETGHELIYLKGQTKISAADGIGNGL